MMRRCFRKTTGFTVVEMLLVISLMSVVGLSVYNCLANGLKIWQRGSQAIVEEDVSIFLDKLKSDLHNCIFYSQIRFLGQSNKLIFASLVRTPLDTKKQGQDRHDDYTDEIGAVEYYFDADKGKVYRRQANYSQSLKNKFGPPRLIASDVRSLSFKYSCFSSQVDVWQDECQDIVPSEIIVEIQFGGGPVLNKMKRNITIPIGS